MLEQYDGDLSVCLIHFTGHIRGYDPQALVFGKICIR